MLFFCLFSKPCSGQGCFFNFKFPTTLATNLSHHKKSWKSFVIIWISSTICSTDNGASIVVLSSIQSGYGPLAGKFCNRQEGVYKDEETSLLAAGKLSFLLRLIHSLISFTYTLGVVHKWRHGIKGEKGCQGFCDNSTKALVMKCVSMGDGVSNTNQICVTIYGWPLIVK
jgi:hypothetical protein